VARVEPLIVSEILAHPSRAGGMRWTGSGTRGFNRRFTA